MRLALPILAIFLALAACEKDDPEPSAPELWCAGFCDAVLRCGGEVTHTECFEGCVDRSASLPMSPEGAALIQPCIANLSCEAVMGDHQKLQQEQQACWREAASTIEAPELVQTFCTHFVTALFECGLWYSTAECDGNYAMWSADFVARLDACVAEPDCDSFLSCVEAEHEAA